jgi:hypothetical protein
MRKNVEEDHLSVELVASIFETLVRARCFELQVLWNPSTNKGINDHYNNSTIMGFPFPVGAVEGYGYWMQLDADGC